VKFDDNVIVTVGAEDFLDGQLHDVGTITDVRWENQYYRGLVIGETSNSKKSPPIQHIPK
jgi:hypothetical protein